MSASRAPAAPKHLRAAGKRLWRSVVNAYELEAHHREILAAACEACDRMTESRERVEEDGIIVSDRFGGLKQHPAAGLERDSRTSMIRALRELGIDIETVAESRPPSRYR